MPFENYVLKQSMWGSEQCIVKLMTTNVLPFYIMGLNFFENYYSVYDKEDKRVGFTISRSASPRIIELYDREKSARNETEETTLFTSVDDQVVNNSAGWDTTSWCVGTLAGSTGIALAIVAFKKMQYEKQLSSDDYN